MFNFPNRLYYCLALVVGISVFSYVIYRAIHLSMTFDECGTTMVLPPSYWHVMFSKQSFQSANNHVLNSILMKLSATIFGTSEWALRLPNVLSYIFYFAGSYIIAWQSSKDNLIRIAALVMFNSLLFILDFFSLTRGYGLANAFELFSISMMIVYFRFDKDRYVFFGFFFAALAVYSNFTWLNFYVPLWAVYNLLIYFELNDWELFLKKCWSKNKFPFLISIVLFALSYRPISILRTQDEFRWGANGWFDSEHTFMKDFLYSNHFTQAVIGQIVLILLVTIAFWICLKLIRLKGVINIEDRNLLFITTLILAIVLATVIQRNLLHMMYMEGRKACLYFPLVIALLVLVMNYFYKLKLVFIQVLAIVITCISIFHFFYKSNLNFVREWWFDENSKQVAYYINDHPINGNRNVALTWYFSSSIRYYNQHNLDTSIKKMSLMEEVNDANEYAYYYVRGNDIKEVPPVYKPIFRFGWDRILLVQDSVNYNNERNRLCQTLDTSNTISNEIVCMKADSILLDERTKIDWTKILISN